MKIPKSRKRYCNKCKKHTQHSVSLAKSPGRNKTHTMSKGSKFRMKKRGQGVGLGNKGKISRGAMSSWKRTGAKISKKIDLRFKCTLCNKTSVQKAGIRTKRALFA